MNCHRAGSFLAAVVLWMVPALSVRADTTFTGFNIVSESGPSFEVVSDEATEKERKRDNTFLGVVGAGALGFLVLAGGGSSGDSGPRAGAEGSDYSTGKFKDGYGIATAPEPGSLALLLGGVLPLLPLIRWAKANK